MQIEEVSPNKPRFSFVVLMFALTILVIFIFACIYLFWRGHRNKNPPFSQHPTASLVSPGIYGAPPARLES